MQATVPSLQIFGRTTQDQGSFDAGRIREYKVIGMPQDRTQRKRVGPLFYWSWAKGDPHSVIALHPHQGFEIFSYVLAGTLIHRDTLGTHRPVEAGGLQLMQTGSGVSHEEVMGAEGTEFFQIWLEPHLRQAIAQPPTYADFTEADFLVQTEPGIRCKQVLGESSPVKLQVPATMVDVEIDPGAQLTYPLAANRAIAALMVKGNGTWSQQQLSQKAQRGDLVSAQNPTPEPGEMVYVSDGNGSRIVLVDVPLAVNYPLYPEF
ncbi:pirin [filamentous cyanobacterium CCP5]|nr:pirin [filamentous cyanobacterium CCP5]